MALPLPLWAIMAGVGTAKAGIDAYSQNRQISRAKQVASDLSQVTPSERDYIKRQRQIAEGGDPLLERQFQRGISATRQQGQVAQQRVTGSLIQQGLENSIVASEIRRKVSQDVMRSIAGQARELADRNMMAKRQAEENILRTQMGIDQRGLESKRMLAQLPTRGEQAASLLGNLAGVGMTAAGQYQEWDTPSFIDENVFKYRGKIYDKNTGEEIVF